MYHGFFWGELRLNETLGSPRWQWGGFLPRQKPLQKLSDVVNAEMQQWWANVYEEQDVFFFPILGACPKLCIFNLNEENHCKLRFFWGGHPMFRQSQMSKMWSDGGFNVRPILMFADGVTSQVTLQCPKLNLPLVYQDSEPRTSQNDQPPATSPPGLLPWFFEYQSYSKKLKSYKPLLPPNPGKTCFLCGKPTTCFFEYQIYHVFFRGTYLEDHPT